MADIETTRKSLREKYDKIATEKGLSAKEYFYILRVAISRAENYYKIFEASSVDVLKHLMNGHHNGALIQAVKIVKALYD